jgi:hypothetical protein
MTCTTTPAGWRFYSADFSCNGKRGQVLLERTPEQKALWHNMDDEVKESEYCPPLYIRGDGYTFEEAMKDAFDKASVVPKISS